ncbi:MULTISPECIES: lipase family protein [unclassified Gordonia (in: high G+C Gram-positive bacteria)]|uniref:lipase family protein n=1 Tax=unclassified Gordonia (in: high G+C Gram-positive bacteria) TaxID=2657482 RepID=UPI001F0F4DAF|nr:lipase family protein [Gordonia sp. ABSL49_1]MCH5642727.1 prolyl oligopeptidase family serine peptidase [Gordonia sp. ABSL49_1]
MAVVVAVVAAMVASSTLVFAAPAASALRVGTVLRTSAIAPDHLPSGAARGYRLLYVTQDQNGRRVTSTGALYLPAGAPPSGGWPVYSWAHGTSGIGDRCSPSIVRGSVRDRLEPGIAHALKVGYAVTASDYPGLGSGGVAEYLGGRAEGSAVIDMIRASRATVPALSRRWVSSGHSQGGHAALWAAYLAPRYAPELALKGTVAIAPASQIENVIPLLLPGTPDLGRYNGFAGLALYVLSGLEHARADLNVDDRLTPAGRSWVARVRNLCVGQLASALREVTPGTLVAKPLTDPAFVAALRDYTTVPAGGYGTPVLIEHGDSDLTIPMPFSVALTAQMRAAGTDVRLITYPGQGHPGVTRAGMMDAFSAISRYFAAP